jgi:hypothetical protein
LQGESAYVAREQTVSGRNTNRVILAGDFWNVAPRALLGCAAAGESLKLTFSMKPSFMPLRIMLASFSPGFWLAAYGGSSAGPVTTAWMLLKEMFRTIPGFSSVPPCCGPRPMEIGPVTPFITMFENDMFSNRESESQRSLIGQP